MRRACTACVACRVFTCVNVARTADGKAKYREINNRKIGESRVEVKCERITEKKAK